MPAVAIDKLNGQTVYAKKAVTGYTGSFTTPRYNFAKDALIGNIYSWVKDPKTGKLYFVFYVTNYDYVNYLGTYLLVDTNTLNIPGYNDVVKEIERQKKLEDEKNAADTKGFWQYNIDKYLPAVLGIATAVFVLPKLIRSNGRN